MTFMEFISLSVSPYSLKAKWALDHHQLDYKYTEHLLIFGAPYVRMRLRKPFGDFTVPAIIDDDIRLMDSFDIAQYADHLGDSPKLFPEGNEEAIEEFNELSEAACDAGRAIVTTRIAKNKAALAAIIPHQLPEFFRKAMASMAPLGIAYLNESFNISSRSLQEREDVLRTVYSEVRAVLNGSGGQYLLGTFTYADIAIAAALQMIKPHASSLVAKNAATMDCWTQPALASEFADLLQWRDRIFDKHFPKKASAH